MGITEENVIRSLSPEEVVATFPKGRSVVRRLLKENKAMIEDKVKVRQEIREFLSSKVSMYDIDIATSIVMATYPSTEKAEENIRRLTRLDFAYAPKGEKTKNGDEIGPNEITRAKEHPIKDLVPVKMNTMLCLWHNDRHPSMHVYKDNHAYCFVCNKRADAIDVAMALTNKSFVDAVRYLI